MDSRRKILSYIKKQTGLTLAKTKRPIREVTFDRFERVTEFHKYGLIVDGNQKEFTIQVCLKSQQEDTEKLEEIYNLLKDLAQITYRRGDYISIKIS